MKAYHFNYTIEQLTKYPSKNRQHSQLSWHSDLILYFNITLR